MSSEDAASLPAAVFTCKDATAAAAVTTVAAAAAADKPCCDKCPSGTDKYFSLPVLFKHNCGESCIAPKDVAKMKLFEPGLTAADSAPLARPVAS